MDELKPPPMKLPPQQPLDSWSKAIVVRQDVCQERATEYAKAAIKARDAQWLALVGELQRDAERLRTLYLAVQSDGYGWWTPDWCIKEGETAPTFDQFRSQIDTERAAIDAARGEKGGV